VVAGPLEAPAATPPDGRPLDSWVRRAPLLLEVDTDRILVAVRVSAEPVSGIGPSESLSDGDLSFSGPERPGSYRLVAETTDSAGTVARQAWLVDVPDRETPADGLYDMPAPEVILSTASGQVAGRLGSGCYVYLCVEAGHAPLEADLGVLPAAVGEAPGLQLGDGSVITAWKGGLTSLETGGNGRLVEASGALSDTAAAMVGLTGLEPPATGRWLLELEVELDRERGWLRTYAVLEVSEPPEPASSSPDVPSGAGGWSHPEDGD
jgi:hypothetical protein